jgi:hypothetical protein
MSLRDKIRQIASEQIKNYTNTVSSINVNNNQQTIVGFVTSLDGIGNAVVQFSDGTNASARISTPRPVGVGTYVIVVGGTIL